MNLRSYMIAGLFLVASTVVHAAPSYLPKATRPTNEPWSDGPTLMWKHNDRQIRESGAAKLAAERCLLSKVRLNSMQQADKLTIGTVGDMRNYLAGCNGTPGSIQSFQGLAGNQKMAWTKHPKRLSKYVAASRERVNDLFAKNHIEAPQQNLIAELMVWRNLAYNSNTLAVGSLAPTDGVSRDFQARARRGLDNAVAASFQLGTRLREGLVQGDKAKAWSWTDMSALASATVWEFADLNRQPGRPRDYNFGPGGFGVQEWGKLHYDANGTPGRGLVHKFHLEMERARAASTHPLAGNPLAFMTKNLYWIHNIHPFCDGNGRTEMLAGWTLARGAGFKLPFDIDMASGEFKLAASKWGGSSLDLMQHLTRGALGAERFARKLLPLIDGGKIVSNHNEQGTVATLVAGRGGERSLLVMFPATFARSMDPELKAEKDKNRVVVTGEQFDPSQIKMQLTVNGKTHTVTPAAIHSWSPRYPWWSTVEPIYKVKLPAGASQVSFKIVGPDGQAETPINYGINLGDYSDINSRPWHRAEVRP
jgi:hypothetical protein